MSWVNVRPTRAAEPAVADALHIGSHRGLLPSLAGTTTRPSPGTLDAVVVPAARPAEHLGQAVEVARRADANLVVLASKETDAREAGRIAVRRLPRDRVTVVQFPAVYQPLGLDFSADQVARPQEHRCVDTSAKRNTGLALATMMGWNRVLFLDDDVHGFGRRQLALLEDGFGAHPRRACAVGWTFDDFPDNSVVCHAHREVGGRQSTFIGAGALGVQGPARMPHFPGLYNEDWLFLWFLIRAGRVAIAGPLKQLRYDPFADPERANRQEFGDTLAEGLYRHVHLRLPVSTLATAGYWRDVLNVRSRFVRQIREAARARPGDETARILACLDSADEARSFCTPRILSDYMTLWQADATAWRRALASAPRVSQVGDALKVLGLVGTEPQPERLLPRMRNWRAGRAPASRQDATVPA